MSKKAPYEIEPKSRSDEQKEAARFARRLIADWEAEKTLPSLEDIDRCLNLLDAPKSVRKMVRLAVKPPMGKQGRNQHEEQDYHVAAAFFVRRGEGLPRPEAPKGVRISRGIRACAKHVEEVTGRTCERAWVRKLIRDQKFRELVEGLRALEDIDLPNLEDVIYVIAQREGIRFTTK